MDKYSLLKSLGLSKIDNEEVFHETTQKVKGLMTAGMDNSTIVEYLLTQELVNQFLNEGDDGSAEATSLVANIRTADMVSSGIADDWMSAWQGTSPVVYDTEHPFGKEMDTDEAEYIVQGMLSDLRIDDVPKSHSATMGSTANLITQLSKTGGPTALASWCSSNLTNLGRAMVGNKTWKYTQGEDSPQSSATRIKNRVFLKKQGNKWYALGQEDLATLESSENLFFVTGFKYLKKKGTNGTEIKNGPEHRGAKQYPESMWFKGATPVEIPLGHPQKFKKGGLSNAKWNYCRHWMFGFTATPSANTSASHDDASKLSRGIVTSVTGYVLNTDALLVKALCASFLTVGKKQTALGVDPNDSLPSDGLKGFALGRTVDQLTVDRPAAEKAAMGDHSDKANDPEAKLAAETGDVESMYEERMESFKTWLNAVSPLQEGQEEPEATFETASIPRVWLIPGNFDHDIRIYFGPNESTPAAALLDEGKRKDDVGNWDEAELSKVWGYHQGMGGSNPSADEIASWAGAYVGLKYIKADVKKTKYRAESTLSSGAFNLAGTGQKDAAKTRGPMYQWLVDLRKWMTRAEGIMSIEQQVGFDTCPLSLSSLGSENVTALTNLLSWEAIQKGAESASTSMPIITTIGSLLTNLGYSIKPLSTGGQGTRSLAQKATSGDTSVSANVMYIAAILMTWARCYRESLNAWIKQLANEAGGDYSAAQDQGTDREQTKQGFLNAGYNPKINTSKVVLNAMEIIISDHPQALQEIKKKEQFMAEKRPKDKGAPVTGKISPAYAQQNRMAKQAADEKSSEEWEKSERSALKTVRHGLLALDDDAEWNALGIDSWDDLDKEVTIGGNKYNLATQLDKYLGKPDAVPQDLTDFYTANKRSAQGKWKEVIATDEKGNRPAYSKQRRGGGPLSEKELEATWSKIHNLLWGLIERMGYPMKNEAGEQVSLPNAERTGAAWAVSTGYRAQLMQSLKTAIEADYEKNKADGDPAYAESGSKKAVDHFLKEGLFLESKEGSLQKASKMLSLIPALNNSSFIDEFRAMVGKVKDGKAVIKKYPGGAFLVDPIGPNRAGVAFIPTGAQPELIKLTNLGQRGPSYEVAAVSDGNSVVLSLIDQTEALLLAKTKLWTGTNPVAQQQQAAQEET